MRPLAAPWRRALALGPFALVLLVAAPLVFQFRDLDALGLSLSWGASVLQAAAGMALVAAALEESVPGRSWSSGALAVYRRGRGGAGRRRDDRELADEPGVARRAGGGRWACICFVASVATALPATVVASILALRALPTRPAVAGLLAGLGGGLMADAGWRLFCHYSEPPHVLASHLGGVFAAALDGAALTPLLAALRRRPAR